MRASQWIGLLLLLPLVAGCGGGDGGKDLAPLTADEAPQTAGIVIEMIGFSEELATVLQDFWFLIEQQAPSGNYPCQAGGSFTATVEDQQPKGQLSTGDRVVLQFFDCGLDASDPSFILNGSFSFEVRSATVALPMEEYVISYSFSNLALSSDNLDFVYNGGLTATEHTDDQVLYTTGIEIDSLQWSLDVPAVGTFDQRISNALLTEDRDDSSDDWTAWIEGDFYDSGVGGWMVLDTVVLFEGNGDNPPDTGSLEINGAGNSRILLTALGGDAVRVQTDADGDGTYESTEDTTWDAISPG